MVFQALCSLAHSDPEAARRLLPLLSVFGQKIKPPYAPDRPPGTVDFRWEREWRYPSSEGNLQVTEADIFIGLCPDIEILEFEALLPAVRFIDPTRNMKWYATKLVEARQRLSLKSSVV